MPQEVKSVTETMDIQQIWESQMSDVKSSDTTFIETSLEDLSKMTKLTEMGGATEIDSQ